MYDLVWKDMRGWAQENASEIPHKPFPDLPVAAAGIQTWGEHCVECAQPQCFVQCPLYSPRIDGNCRRFAYGLMPVPAVQGLFEYGVDCRFKKWSKLQSVFDGRMVSVASLHRFDRIDRGLTSIARGLSRAAVLLPRDRRPMRIYGPIRELLKRAIPGARQHRPDAFVLECYSFENEPVGWPFEVEQRQQVRFRHRFEVVPGWNRFVIPYDEMGISEHGALIMFASEGDRSFRLLLTWADFVVFQDSTNKPTAVIPSAPDPPAVDAEARPAASQLCPHAAPAARVKCVAWDLDNTLWKGILIEDGVDAVTINPEAVDVIRKLDERGILNTIVSKNDHDQAWSVVERFGLADYFVYPAINWRPKSANLREVAARFNFGLDTFLLVDDSAFERAEVSETLSMVRVVAETEISRLLALPALDVPVTAASRTRRLSYLTDMRRDSARAECQGGDLAFLRSCNLRMTIETPSSAADVARCLELIQRSNQLNLSSRRYDAAAFGALLSSPEYACFAIRCRDRFGDYGIVGFVAVQESSPPVITEIVISCRIAKKRCEHAFLRWLAIRERHRGQTCLMANLIRTDRNGPLALVFQETPFAVARETDTDVEYALDLGHAWDDEQIVTIDS